MSFNKFPMYLPGSDLAYHQATDWANERAALKAQKAKLLNLEEANALNIGEVVGVGNIRLKSGHMLYKPMPAKGLEVCNLPYKVLQQIEISPKGKPETYAQMVEAYVAANFEKEKFLCVLDPRRCCVIQHENFSYKLLQDIQNPHKNVPLALVDRSHARAVLFEFEMPIQRLCDRNPEKLGGHAFKYWSKDFDAFCAASGPFAKYQPQALEAVRAMADQRQFS